MSDQTYDVFGAQNVAPGVFERYGEESKPEFEANRGTTPCRGKKNTLHWLHVASCCFRCVPREEPLSRQRHDVERGTSSIMTSRPASS